MNIALTTSGPAAVADAAQHFAPRAKTGQIGCGADAYVDGRSEVRTSAAIAATVRTDLGENRGCIRNLSPRGLMLSMENPPKRGDFVDIITGRHALIGQVKWGNDSRAGIRLSEAVDVGSVMLGSAGSFAAKPRPVRKTMSAPVAVHSPRDSHIIARQMQFAAVIAFGAFAALMISLCVNDFLVDVITQVRTGLPG